MSHLYIKLNIYFKAVDDVTWMTQTDFKKRCLTWLSLSAVLKVHQNSSNQIVPTWQADQGAYDYAFCFFITYKWAQWDNVTLH